MHAWKLLLQDGEFLVRTENVPSSVQNQRMEYSLLKYRIKSMTKIEEQQTTALSILFRSIKPANKNKHVQLQSNHQSHKAFYNRHGSCSVWL